MKVLVIEDTNSKYESIKGYLNQLGISNITRKVSVNGGLIELLYEDNLGNPYDLCICDMVLPLYESEAGNMQIKGGERIVREIDRRNYSTKVIMCSSEECNPKYECVIGTVKYDRCVYQLSAFEELVTKYENEKACETFVLMYHSFDSSTIKKCDSRSEALRYIRKDFDEELRIQTTENGKVVGEDLEIVDDIDNGEFAKMTFKNGDFITWEIPDVI